MVLMNQQALVVTAGGRPAIELFLSRLDDLFNAPRLNPLSRSPMEILGVSGVEYLLGQLQTTRSKRGVGSLVLLLPPQTFTAPEAQSTALALRTHLKVRIDHEVRAMRATRHYGLRVFGVGLMMLAILLALSAFFASDLTAGMPQLLRRPLEYGFEIVGWVMMWHPIEVFLFNPMANLSRINALRALSEMDITMRAYAGAPQDGGRGQGLAPSAPN